jgi:hypothetical protein
MSRRFRFSEDEVRAAVAASRSYADVLRHLGLRTAGGNHATIRRYVDEVWNVSTLHFDPDAARSRARRASAVPLDEVLIAGSTYSRGSLKKRLLREGLKEPRCEMCGQGEVWRGRPLSLVLDHVNGVHDDHRIDNLRILCPNCNATLDTHCGKHNRRKHPDRSCPTCRAVFRPASGGQRYCSSSCAGRGERSRAARLATRRVERPPYDQLMREIAELGYLAVGRRYGVSDNAVRKWRRAYEAATALGAPAGEPAPAPISGPGEERVMAVGL